MKNYFTPLWCITLFLALNLLSSVTVQAADRYAVANGNWDAASTWSATSGGTGGASIPVAGDDVYFGETTTAWTVTIPNGYAAACSNLFIGSNNIVAQTLTLSTATGSLAVSGNVILYGPINTTGNVSRTLNVNAGTLSIGGNLELGNGQNGISGNRRCIVNITTGSITVNGNIIFDNVIGSA
ncbi:MAG: hypothetical protein Q8M94_17960, partial [Ignavibacteria bacterium]|nr:hypothetical protein [Ignavibacteria bacterium]